MYTRTILWLCLFGFVFNAPIEKQPLVEKSAPQKDLLPEFKEATNNASHITKYETLGKNSNLMNNSFIFFYYTKYCCL